MFIIGDDQRLSVVCPLTGVTLLKEISLQIYYRSKRGFVNLRLSAFGAVYTATTHDYQHSI